MGLHKLIYSVLVAAGLSVVVSVGSINLLAAQTPPNSPATPAQSPQVQPPTGLTPANQYFLNRLNAPMTLGVYLERLGREFRVADADADGQISEEDVILRPQFASAAFRATFLGQFLRFDLDGDGAVTEEEMRKVLTYDRYVSRSAVPPSTTADDQIESRIREIMAADADHDGRVTFAEALNYVKSLPNPAADYAAKSVRQLIALAPDGKKVLTFDDYEAAAEALFHAVDTDGDGTISVEELKNFRAQANPSALQNHGAATPAPPTAGTPAEAHQPSAQNDAQARLEQAAKQREVFLQQRAAEAQRAVEAQHAAEVEKEAACAMPQASDAAKVMLIASHGPEALSSATIGSQDIAVRVGTIDVQSGREPIYLVITSFEPTIWRFRGAVARIERLILMNGRPPPQTMPGDQSVVGATNVPAEKITFLPAGKCIEQFIEAQSTEGATAAAVIKRRIGKDVTTIASRQSFSEVTVPSGRIRSLRGPTNQFTIIKQSAGVLKITGNWRNVVVQAGPGDPTSDLKRFSPGGVIQIDPRSVVASLPVERYKVLPEEAGLAQLLKEHKIAQNRTGEYLIKKKIRFPADLYGAHSAKFLLLRGVEPPDGDPGHSVVVSEETGKKI